MSEGQQFVRFNPPPGWPLPPSSQLPPEQWAPPGDWGPAPDGWVFYVDGANRPVPPPLGAWRPGGALGSAGTPVGYAAPDPWATQTQTEDPWAAAPAPGGSATPGGWPGAPGTGGPAPGYAPPPGPGGWAPAGQPGYPQPGTPGYAPPGTAGWQPPGTGGGGSRLPLIIAAGVVLLLLLAGGGFLLARRGSDPAPTAAPSPGVTAPTTGAGRTSTTEPGPTVSPTSGAPTTATSTGTGPATPGAAPTAPGPELTEAQLRAMLAGRKFGGIDGLYNVRKPTWDPAPTAVVASIPECTAYLSFERANNTWFARDTDATAPTTVLIYAYTSARAKADQIPLDIACGKALEAKGDQSWVFKSRSKFGDHVEVFTWESDGELVTEYHYGNLRFSIVGNPDPAFASAAIAQIDGAAK